MQTHEIRERFINHFVKAGHTEVPSASLILDDPNLLFVNAGMVPFKPYFLGEQNPPFPNGTATSIQKCVRTLDIEEVGITTRHNTFFQMAGNFSFGQYFKEGAISNAWSLLTNSVADGGFGLDPERLWVTVYLDDDEAAAIWHEKIGIPEERIQRLGMADNYWSMGIPGPCGPCSEIYYDRGEAYGEFGGPVVDDTRYIELWNLVFMQNERGEGTGKDSFEIVGPLPKKNIDTGMGVERVACILQGVENVYETDLLAPVITVAEQLTGATYGRSETLAKAGDTTSAAYHAAHTEDIRFRVIADHCRTGLMLILDGVTPGNEGRGYILRRLLRRIIRSARLLGATGVTMEKLMDTVRATMTPSYPEIADNWERIRAVAVGEETAFLKTLESGTRLFEDAAAKVKASAGTILDGDAAFTLHDTHGFPIDLTVEMAAESGLTVDTEAFDARMAEQKARAKADNRAKKHAHADVSVYRPFVDNHATVFLGYGATETEGRILGLVAGGALVDRAGEGSKVQVILDQTPFYAESGGQLADRGTISGPGGVAAVEDVQKTGKKVWLHNVTVTGGELAVGDTVTATVDHTWRHQARQAHSGTHLIHAALRQVLGPTAVQAGSMNRPGYLRFDFSYGEQLTADQLRRIELIANEAVDTDYTVNTIETSLDEAKAMGAMALFGENYGTQVRVVEIGGPFSMELCGGIHVSHSSQIGPVTVLGESSVGSGVRRIEAYTGVDSFRFLADQHRVSSALSSRFRVPVEEVPERVESISARLHEMEKRITQFRTAELSAKVGDYVMRAATVGDLRVVAARVPDGISGGDLRTLANEAKGRVGSEPAVAFFISADPESGKVPFIAAATDAAVALGVSAGEIVKAVAPYVGGRGGGKPAMAQGSGSDAAGIDAAVAAVRGIVEQSVAG
ncbi:alanine--tRNA ligase [Corynebacterium terpenotabidum]|uniref:Alanine--tRNA ligase n=1 Tax=Corynebacterium terpenotabidum Y-11 TaxID=1200352 RepID=S4XE65_9CORY|nr:alanine--tRNA ligase [Corynebacterium terpenotabidum]AGP30849.1 alanyl-tRNA ligase [Corynebacterium terpenotabidum Y-11]